MSRIASICIGILRDYSLEILSAQVWKILPVREQMFKRWLWFCWNKKLRDYTQFCRKQNKISEVRITTTQEAVKCKTLLLDTNNRALHQCSLPHFWEWQNAILSFKQARLHNKQHIHNYCNDDIHIAWLNRRFIYSTCKTDQFKILSAWYFPTQSRRQGTTVLWMNVLAKCCYSGLENVPPVEWYNATAN